MRWQLELVSGPDLEAVTLAEMKLHLAEYASTDRDGETAALIKEGREWVEDFTGMALMDETWRLSIDQGDQWLDEEVSTLQDAKDFYLRRAPILSILSVKTVDADGAETEVDASEYELRAADSKWPFLAPTSGGTWQSSNLHITFRAGFADLTSSPQQDATVVPELFKRAIKLYASWQRNSDRDAESALVSIAKRLKAQVGFA